MVYDPTDELVFRGDRTELPAEISYTPGTYTVDVYENLTDNWIETASNKFLDAGCIWDYEFYYDTYEEPVDTGPISDVPEFRWGYDWFDYANLCIELYDGDEYDAYGLKVYLAYDDSYPGAEICRYRGDPIWVQVDPSYDYAILIIDDCEEIDRVITDQSFSLDGSLDPNAFQRVDLYLP